MVRGIIPIVHLHPATPELSVKRLRQVRYHILECHTDGVEERAQVLAEQRHADGGNDGDERDQKRVLGGDGARTALRKAKVRRF